MSLNSAAKKVWTSSRASAESDHFCPEAADIHIVIFDALAGAELVVDKPGTDAGDLVGRDGHSHAARADRDPAFHLTCRDRPGQGDDEVRVIVSGGQLVRRSP